MTACAFLGLGIMGREMARNLLDGGHEVTVYNRSPAPVELLVDMGAHAATTPAEAASEAEVVLLCLADGAAVEQVVLGGQGVLEGARAGTIVIDHSTIDPATSEHIAARCAERGIQALDAPVSGGDVGARDATLSIMVGGEVDAFARARPLLEVLGRTIEHVGVAGAGQRVKAANQLLVGGIYTLVSEALLLMEDQRVDTDAALVVLGGGLAGSRILELKGPSMHRRSFEAGAKVELQRKDLRIALDLARDAGIAVPVTAVVAQLYEALVAQGGGALDHSAILTVLEQLAGQGSPAAFSDRSTG